MSRLVRMLAISLITLLVGVPVTAQSSPTDYRDEFLRHFNQSSSKIVALAEAVPQDLYEWSPGEGVMHVAQVYMHIARYNFMYLETSLGIDAPQDVDQNAMESIIDKERVLELLQRSVTHVREHVASLSQEDITRSTVLYGRNVAGWAVLFQLLAHMNEHVGQSVAYARTNNIVPPWSS